MIAPCTPEMGHTRDGAHPRWGTPEMGHTQDGAHQEPLCDICDVMLRYAWDAVLIQGRYLLIIHPSFPAEASMLLNR